MKEVGNMVKKNSKPYSNSNKKNMTRVKKNADIKKKITREKDKSFDVTTKIRVDLDRLNDIQKEFVLNDLESGLLEITIECVIDNRTIKQIRVDKIVVCEKLGKLELIPEVEELKEQVAELKEQVTKFKELIKALYSIDIGGEEQ